MKYSHASKIRLLKRFMYFLIYLSLENLAEKLNDVSNDDIVIFECFKMKFCHRDSMYNHIATGGL